MNLHYQRILYLCSGSPFKAVWLARYRQREERDLTFRFMVKKTQKRTTPGIPRWSPTRVLIWRSSACLWESGRDPEFSDVYGRTWKKDVLPWYMKLVGRFLLGGPMPTYTSSDPWEPSSSDVDLGRQACLQMSTERIRIRVEVSFARLPCCPCIKMTSRSCVAVTARPSLTRHQHTYLVLLSGREVVLMNDQ
jgi:hypothetical protein